MGGAGGGAFGVGPGMGLGLVWARAPVTARAISRTGTVLPVMIWRRRLANTDFMEATILFFSVKRALEEDYRPFTSKRQPGRRRRQERGAAARSGQMQETCSTRGGDSQNRTKSELLAVIRINPNRKLVKHNSA